MRRFVVCTLAVLSCAVAPGTARAAGLTEPGGRGVRIAAGKGNALAVWTTGPVGATAPIARPLRADGSPAPLPVPPRVVASRGG